MHIGDFSNVKSTGNVLQRSGSHTSLYSRHLVCSLHQDNDLRLKTCALNEMIQFCFALRRIVADTVNVNQYRGVVSLPVLF